MSTETAQDPVISRLYTHLNEEKVTRDLSSVQLQKIKTLDELMQEIQASGKKDELIHTEGFFGQQQPVGADADHLLPI